MRVITILILFYGHLYALERKSTLKVYHTVFSTLSSKKPIEVFVNDKEYLDVFKYSKTININSNVLNSDILLATNKDTLTYILRELEKNTSIGNKRIIFVTDYHLLKVSEVVVGAIYWRKGRSQIIFIKDRLENFHIQLPDTYKKYTVEEL